MDAVAQRRLGIDELRSGQAEAIEALLDGRDVLAVMATGYGKSAIFQIAAAMVDGLTIVVSPLVALQQDQVESLNSRSRPSAPIGAALNSKISATERDEIWESVEAGTLDILYLAPEQLTRDDVRTRLAAVGVALVAVDEAHCVSSWGHEFRPDYLRVGEAVAALSAPPIIALTATASPPVRDDIVDKLHMRDPVRITGGFDRPEIRLEARMHPDGAAASDAAVEDVCAQKGQGLVYTDTKAGAEELVPRVEIDLTVVG